MKHLTGHHNALDSRTDFFDSFVLHIFICSSIHISFLLFVFGKNEHHSSLLCSEDRLLECEFISVCKKMFEEVFVMILKFLWKQKKLRYTCISIYMFINICNCIHYYLWRCCIHVHMIYRYVSFCCCSGRMSRLSGHLPVLKTWVPGF